MGKEALEGLLRFAGRCTRPSFLPPPPKRRPASSAKTAGLAFEDAVADALGECAARGEWFTYTDARGDGWCQTDFLIPAKDGVIFVLEAKLNWVSGAAPKLKNLYVPVVSKALGRRALGIVVCKGISSACDGIIVQDLESAKGIALLGGTPVLLFNPKVASIFGLAPQKRTRGARGPRASGKKKA